MSILAEIIFEEGKGFNFIGLVNRPAIDVVSLKLAKEHEIKFSIDADQQLMIGPVLIPNKQYFRNKDYFGGDESGYVFFSKETIKKLGIDYIKNAKGAINLEHKDSLKPEDTDLVEMWYVETPNDKAYDLGFSKEDCPIGTLFMSLHINNADIWSEVKKGTYNGFSIQGFLAKNIIGTGLNLKKEYSEDEIVGIVVGLCLAEITAQPQTEPPVIAQDNTTKQIDTKLLYNWNDGKEDVKVNSVNGDAVRTNGFDQWVDGGNHYVDADQPADKQLYAKFIPEDEIWVDDVFLVKPDDAQAIELHEMLERSLIKDYGFKYSNDVDGAHEIANGAEVQLRNQAQGQKNDQLRQSIYTDFLKKYGADKQKFTSSGLSGKTTTHKVASATGGTLTGHTGVSGATSGATTPSGNTSGATATISGATTGTTGQTGTTQIKMGVNKSVVTSEDNQNLPTTVTSGVRYAKTRRNDGVIVTDNDLMKAMITWKTPEERLLAVKKWKSMRDKQESVQLSQELSLSKPSAGEDKKHFISRCIKTVMDDGSARSTDQAVAMCESMWEKKGTSMSVEVGELKLGPPDNFPNSDNYGALSGGRVGGSAQRDRSLKTIDKKKQIKQQADAIAKQRAFDIDKAEAQKKVIEAKQKALKQDKSKPTAVQALDLPNGKRK